MKHTTKTRGVSTARSRRAGEGASLSRTPSPRFSPSQSRTLNAVALHWFTFYASVHGALPRPWPRKHVCPALLDIVAVQCGWNERRALALVEEIVAAKVAGNTLKARWEAFWAASYGATLAEARECVRRNARGAA